MTMSEQLQRAVCTRIGAPFSACAPDTKVGIARTVLTGAQPLHGLRIQPKGDTCGWYIWAGERSDDPDFFVPLHVSHLHEWAPAVLPYLGLPPGWRFLVAPGYEDVWHDPQLV
jgi:hypothetical protein